MDRRHFAKLATGRVAGLAMAPFGKLSLARSPSEGRADEAFQLRYLVASCLYGYAKLADILPEVAKCGATAIDIWTAVHGNQREQMRELGEEPFAAMLQQHQISLGCITQYQLGQFGLQEELRLAGRLGCHLIVTGGRGPTRLRAAELKWAVADFVEKMKPHLAIADANNVVIAIENHPHNLFDTPDALKWLGIAIIVSSGIYLFLRERAVANLDQSR